MADYDNGQEFDAGIMRCLSTPTKLFIDVGFLMQQVRMFPSDDRIKESKGGSRVFPSKYRPMDYGT